MSDLGTLIEQFYLTAYVNNLSSNSLIRSVLILLFFSMVAILPQEGYATHNRAGEITYKHISGFTYEVTILTCTDISLNTNADREFMPIQWGHFIGPDGQVQDSIQRTSEVIVVPGSVKKNLYVAIHTFPGIGEYRLYSEDPNRNAGVNNIPNSVDQIFSLTTYLHIYADPLIGFNNSVELLNPPKEDGCVNRLWSHGVEAYDVDGDSLVFELIPCTGGSGITVNGYLFPDEYPSPGLNGVMEFDQEFGIVTWDTPVFVGLYNIAIRISEYRYGILMGSVVRDMQIEIDNCPNQPPVNDPLPDLCVVAGEDLAVQISAEDPDGNSLELHVEGEPFEMSNAQFTLLSTNPAMGTMQWTPGCAAVRSMPYMVFVRSEDHSSSPVLSDNDGFNVQVIAPPVQNLLAESIVFGTMDLTWDEYVCSQASAFKIYRRVGSNPFAPEECETGLDDSEGYSLIATIDSDGTSAYSDTDVPFGNEVCYRVVACFSDGSESIVSDESCSMIEMVIPVMTHVSVGVTDPVNGVDTVRWLAPLELDTLVSFTGPYHYEVYRSAEQGGDFVQVFETVPSTVLNVGEMEYLSEGLDTESIQYRYEVVLLNDGVPVSTSNQATSIFLQGAPGDEEIILSWDMDVPWLNTEFRVYRFDDDLLEFVQIGLSNTPEFIDQNLENNREYCYLVRSEGAYSNSGIDSLFNFSQEICAQPFDNTPPCAPTLAYSGTCESGDYQVTWSFPTDGCAADVAGYLVYYSATSEGALELIDEIQDPADSLLIEFEGGLYGCFAIAAYDSLSQRPDGTLGNNTSELSNIVCLESCPDYVLPDVFSPNGDGFNDEFRPFLPISYVDSVDLKIFNRWGGLVFESVDPLIKWKGENQVSGEKVSDGVYFYTISIFEKSLEGILPRKEAGTIHIFDNRKSATE